MARSSRPAYSPLALDVAAFCRHGAELQGQWSLAELPRLAESVLRGADGFADAPVEWVATGAMHRVSGSEPHCLIDLQLRTQVTLECQRCLQPMAVPLEVARRFRFVHGEDEAARLDEEEAGDDEDVLALAPRFDLRGLIEDELLLALPLVPRHETCPALPEALRPPAQGASAAPAEAAEPARDHPFAALAALRRPKA